MDITADSKPVYCWFGGNDCWSCNDLINWHVQMIAKYGQAEANKRFIDSFTNDTPIVCEQLDCRSLNSNFRQYFEQQGILSDLYTGIGVIAQPIGFGSDIINKAGDAIKDVANIGTNTTKTLSYLVPTLLIIASIVAVVYAIKQLKIA